MENKENYRRRFKDEVMKVIPACIWSFKNYILLFTKTANCVFHPSSHTIRIVVDMKFPTDVFELSKILSFTVTNAKELNGHKKVLQSVGFLILLTCFTKCPTKIQTVYLCTTYLIVLKIIFKHGQMRRHPL